MSARADPHPIRDFFIADLIDYAPKDSAEMMERPFFSIAKRKRNKPIHYETPDGKLWIKVNGNPTDDLGRRYPDLVHFPDRRPARRRQERSAADHSHDAL